MALMMMFSNKNRETFKNEAIRHGFSYYQTDNIYLFLRYAKEAKPDVVMMDFEDDFNCDRGLMGELKKNLCESDVCPRIFLSRFANFEGKTFFEKTDFDKADVQKYLN